MDAAGAWKCWKDGFLVSNLCLSGALVSRLGMIPGYDLIRPGMVSPTVQSQPDASEQVGSSSKVILARMQQHWQVLRIEVRQQQAQRA